MTKNELTKKLKIIREALKLFPKIVKQNEMRGRSHRKLLKAFAPAAKSFAKRKKSTQVGT
jgi:hypothetical protein